MRIQMAYRSAVYFSWFTRGPRSLIEDILNLYNGCFSPMDHQSNKGNSIGTNRTNRTIGTNGRVEWTATHPETLEDIPSLYNVMHFTNGSPIG